MVPCTASQVEKILLTNYLSRVDTWVHGDPGIGKTALFTAVCKQNKIPFIVHPPAVTIESVDLRGIPFIQDGITHWASPSFWPTDPDWRGLVFLDELPQGSRSVQAAYMQAIQSKKLGDMILSPGANFVVAGNYAGTKSGVGPVIMPLLNRFCHVDMVADVRDWLGWAVTANVHQKVRAYIASNPKALMSFDATANQRAFASPRTWEAVSKVMHNGIPAGLDVPMLAGTIGEGEASAFRTYLRFVDLLPDPSACLADPDHAPLPATGQPSTAAVYCTLAVALAECLKGDNGKRADALCRYVLRWGDTHCLPYQVLCIRDAGYYYPRLARTPVLAQWLGKHSKILM